jgi:hypothetical protein
MVRVRARVYGVISITTTSGRAVSKAERSSLIRGFIARLYGDKGYHNMLRRSRGAASALLRLRTSALTVCALTAWLVWAGARLEAQAAGSASALNVLELAILALLAGVCAARWARDHARRVLSAPPPRRRRLFRL